MPSDGREPIDVDRPVETVDLPDAESEDLTLHEHIISQTTWRPNRKVTVGTLALLVWEVFESVMIHEVGVQLTDVTWSALNMLIPALAAYWVPEGP